MVFFVDLKQLQLQLWNLAFKALYLLFLSVTDDVKFQGGFLRPQQGFLFFKLLDCLIRHGEFLVKGLNLIGFLSNIVLSLCSYVHRLLGLPFGFILHHVFWFSFLEFLLELVNFKRQVVVVGHFLPVIWFELINLLLIWLQIMFLRIKRLFFSILYLHFFIIHLFLFLSHRLLPVFKLFLFIFKDLLFILKWLFIVLVQLDYADL